jgi:hypothetical protein
LWDQSLNELDMGGFRCVLPMDFGTFVGLDKRVLFYHEKFTVKFALEDLRGVTVAGDEIWFHFPNRLEFVATAVLRNALFGPAMAQEMFEYAAVVAVRDEDRRTAFAAVEQALSRKKAGEFLISLGWGLQRVMAAVDILSPAFLLYLQDALGNISPANAAQRAALCQWVFVLYSMRFPRGRRSFLAFLSQFAAVLDRETVYRRLREVNFVEGMLHFASVLGDAERELALSFELGKYEFVVQRLAQLEERNQFTRTACAILQTEYREQARAIVVRELRFRPIEAYMAVALALPEIVWRCIDQKFVLANLPPTIGVLLVASLAKLGEEDKLTDSRLLAGRTPLPLILRFCRQYGCSKAAARVFVALARPEAAAEIAYRNLGIAGAHALLGAIEASHLKKRAFIRFMRIASPDERIATLALPAYAGLLDFEELVEFLEDDAPFASVEDQFIEFVQMIEDRKMMGAYAREFPEKPTPAFMLGLDECCALCRTILMGRQFVRFRCGHMVHCDCMRRRIERLKDDLRGHSVEIWESCPICGFLGVLFASEPFDDAALETT